MSRTYHCDICGRECETAVDRGVFDGIPEKLKAHLCPGPSYELDLCAQHYEMIRERGLAEVLVGKFQIQEMEKQREAWKKRLDTYAREAIELEHQLENFKEANKEYESQVSETNLLIEKLREEIWGVYKYPSEAEDLLVNAREILPFEEDEA